MTSDRWSSAAVTPVTSSGTSAPSERCGKALEGANASRTLTDLLDLHEHQRAKTRDLRVVRQKGADPFKGVVLDGDRVVGVVLIAEPGRQQPAKPALSGSSGRDTEPKVGPEESAFFRDESGAGGRGAGGGARRAARSPDASAETSSQRAFPLVKAPDIVTSRQEFSVTVGLARSPVKGVTGDAMTINVPTKVETFTLDVQVAAAEGFKAPKGWRHTLTLQSSNIFKGRLEIPLAAAEVAGESLLSVVSVHFSHEGVHLGTATRRIEVARTVGRGKKASAWVRATPRPAAMTMDMSARAPDLTIRIEKPDADEATGKFVWTFETPHKGIKLPPKPPPMNLGTDARTFAKALITLIDENSGGQLIAPTMRGIGTKIAQKVPADAWRVLSDVAATVGNARPVTVLLYSAETSVPWELAAMPKPLDAKKPPYLGAQVALGRWILGTNGPSVPPARAVNVEKMVIVTGYYKAESKLSRLEGAEEESKLLQTAYGAVGLDATPENVRELFEGTIADADKLNAIHFACHGEVQPGSPELNAIFLSDGSPLNQYRIHGRADRRAIPKPILFLNACQVGTQGELLGESAGFGAGCLYAGFRAFVAPLWSIDDTTAREVALDFYRTAFDANKRTFVSTFFQNIRGKFAVTSKSDIPESTYLAYVYYGHPELLLSTQQLGSFSVPSRSLE